MSDKEIEMLQEHKVIADNIIEQYATKCKRNAQYIDELEKALEMACVQLDEARDMLFECNKPEWARMLDTSADYFKARARKTTEWAKMLETRAKRESNNEQLVSKLDIPEQEGKDYERDII